MAKKFRFKEKINPQSLMILIFFGLSESILIHLTNRIVGIAGRDAWLVPILGSILGFLLVYILVTLANRFPKESFFQYSKKIWGKPLTYLIAIGYFLYWLSYIVLFLEDTVQINRLYFLQKTPAPVQIALLLLGLALLVSYGLRHLVLFFQVILPFFIVLILPAIGLSLLKLNLSSFFPILANGFLPIIKALILYLGFLQGIEIILFVYPSFYNNNRKPLLKNALGGIALVGFFALLQIVVSIGGIGVNCANKVLWGNMMVLEIIEIPAFIGERFDLLFTFAWFISLFCAGAFFYYLATFGLVKAFNLKKKRIILILVGIIAGVAFYIIPSYSWSNFIWYLLNYITIVFIFIIPLLTLLLAFLRKKGGQSYE